MPRRSSAWSGSSAKSGTASRARDTSCRRSVLPGRPGRIHPRMMLEILGSYSAEALVEMLQEGDPAILVTRTDNSESENGIYINLMTLTDEEVEIGAA